MSQTFFELYGSLRLVIFTCATGANFTHKVNFTYEINFTYPAPRRINFADAARHLLVVSLACQNGE